MTGYGNNDSTQESGLERETALVEEITEIHS